MPFDIREVEAKAEAEFPPFEFVDRAGETRKLRSFALAPATTLAQMQQLAEAEEARDGDEMSTDEVVASVDAVREMLESVAVDDESAAAVAELGPYVLGQLLYAWREASPELGKSEEPSPPPNRAGRRSKSTPKAAAKKSGASRSTKSER